MISERESRIRLAEDCKYLTSKLPFGNFNFHILEFSCPLQRGKDPVETTG